MNNINYVIKTIMRNKHVTQTEIAKLFGVSPQAVYNKFRRESWNLDEIIKILDYMDCRLVIESDIVSYKIS